MRLRRFVRTSKRKRKQITCHSTDCYDFPHRLGGGKCKFLDANTYKDGTPIDFGPPSKPDDEYPF